MHSERPYDHGKARAVEGVFTRLLGGANFVVMPNADERAAPPWPKPSNSSSHAPLPTRRTTLPPRHAPPPPLGRTLSLPVAAGTTGPPPSAVPATAPVPQGVPQPTPLTTTSHTHVSVTVRSGAPMPPNPSSSPPHARGSAEAPLTDPRQPVQAAPPALPGGPVLPAPKRSGLEPFLNRPPALQMSPPHAAASSSNESPGLYRTHLSDASTPGAATPSPNPPRHPPAASPAPALQTPSTISKSDISSLSTSPSPSPSPAAVEAGEGLTEPTPVLTPGALASDSAPSDAAPRAAHPTPPQPQFDASDDVTPTPQPLALSFRSDSSVERAAVVAGAARAMCDRGEGDPASDPDDGLRRDIRVEDLDGPPSGLECRVGPAPSPPEPGPVARPEPASRHGVDAGVPPSPPHPTVSASVSPPADPPVAPPVQLQSPADVPVPPPAEPPVSAPAQLPVQPPVRAPDLPPAQPQGTAPELPAAVAMDVEAPKPGGTTSKGALGSREERNGPQPAHATCDEADGARASSGDIAELERKMAQVKADLGITEAERVRQLKAVLDQHLLKKQHQRPPAGKGLALGSRRSSTDHGDAFSGAPPPPPPCDLVPSPLPLMFGNASPSPEIEGPSELRRPVAGAGAAGGAVKPNGGLQGRHGALPGGHTEPAGPPHSPSGHLGLGGSASEALPPSLSPRATSPHDDAIQRLEQHILNIETKLHSLSPQKPTGEAYVPRESGPVSVPTVVPALVASPVASLSPRTSPYGFDFPGTPTHKGQPTLPSAALHEPKPQDALLRSPCRTPSPFRPLRHSQGAGRNTSAPSSAQPRTKVDSEAPQLNAPVLNSSAPSLAQNFGSAPSAGLPVMQGTARHPIANTVIPNFGTQMRPSEPPDHVLDDTEVSWTQGADDDDDDAQHPTFTIASALRLVTGRAPERDPRPPPGAVLRVGGPKALGTAHGDTRPDLPSRTSSPGASPVRHVHRPRHAPRRAAPGAAPPDWWGCASDSDLDFVGPASRDDESHEAFYSPSQDSTTRRHSPSPAKTGPQIVRRPLPPDTGSSRSHSPDSEAQDAAAAPPPPVPPPVGVVSTYRNQAVFEVVEGDDASARGSSDAGVWDPDSEFVGDASGISHPAGALEALSASQAPSDVSWIRQDPRGARATGGYDSAVHSDAGAGRFAAPGPDAALGPGAADVLASSRHSDGGVSLSRGDSTLRFMGASLAAGGGVPWTTSRTLRQPAYTAARDRGIVELHDLHNVDDGIASATASDALSEAADDEEWHRFAPAAAPLRSSQRRRSSDSLHPNVYARRILYGDTAVDSDEGF